ncbi:histone-lysine N-methyltransferase SUV39H2-like [Eriocheir sinensis]|uniref:histone-lysine N-methyltransferase SUV39H2-like n=1 Tax=Eriocheir sinensis TaxID=95602 RepID=UPI0021CA814F|nr:histone-lysine N-methyltransferase SUV39H2-like [Eriocheir sinensis]
MMGNLLKKETGDKCDDKTFPVPSLNASDLPLLPSHTPDHSDIPGKTSGVAGITPPASEVGSDEILARNLENTCGGMKRKTRASESPQKSKRPKRSLIDSYLIKDESVSKKTKEEEDEEEEEFEVESIIDFKKTQRDRYYKYLRQLLEDKLTKELRSKRDVQMAELRKWERKINTICSDPAKLCVENTVDLELPPMDFKYINECLCNKRCSCGPNCSNRVVQKGRNISLCIFRTANGRGWGVKAMENIKKDSLVTEYVGEVISSEEAERRGKIYDAQNCTYLFDLDYNKGDQNPYTVDAAKCGNVSHFINHSLQWTWWLWVPSE